MASADDSGRGYEDSEVDSEGAQGEAPTSEEQTTGDWEDGDDVTAPSEEPPYLEEPGQGTGLRANGQPSDGDVRSEQDKWRRWAWAALVVLVIGVAWALALSTILLNRSGDNTAELIALFEKSPRAAQGRRKPDLTEPRRQAGSAARHASRVAGLSRAGGGRSRESGREQRLSPQSPGARGSRRRPHQPGEHGGGARPDRGRKREPPGALPRRHRENSQPDPGPAEDARPDACPARDARKKPRPAEDTRQEHRPAANTRENHRPADHAHQGTLTCGGLSARPGTRCGR